MKKSLLLIALTVLSVLVACTGSHEENYRKVDEAARRDAAKVAEAPEGSMQRENAVLEIRVKERALRKAGYNREADRYVQETGKLLIDSMHIIEDR